MGAFKKSFWVSFALAAAILLGALAMASRIDSADLPPKPAFPVPGKLFVAGYEGQEANVAELAYWWNLFGIASAIRRADVVLLGSSHMQFGLSARQLSADFSRQAGRPIRVFNAGLGCDTPLSVDASLLEHLDIRDRVVIADGFAYEFDPYTYDCFQEFAAIKDRVQALFETLAIWSRFDWDWMLDGYLPRFDLRDRRLTIGRYLNGEVTVLDWNYGDVAYLYAPELGEVFPGSASGQKIAIGPAWRLASGTIPLPAAFQGVTGPRRIRPIFTLIPFVLSPGFNLDRYENLVHLLASAGPGTGVPFVDISAAGLTSFDDQHLTGTARAVATERLAAALEASGLLPSVAKR
jgi:hypothetical protein